MEYLEEHRSWSTCREQRLFAVFEIHSLLSKHPSRKKCSSSDPCIFCLLSSTKSVSIYLVTRWKYTQSHIFISPCRTGPSQLQNWRIKRFSRFLKLCAWLSDILKNFFLPHTPKPSMFCPFFASSNVSSGLIHEALHRFNGCAKIWSAPGRWFLHANNAFSTKNVYKAAETSNNFTPLRLKSYSYVKISLNRADLRFYLVGTVHYTVTPVRQRHTSILKRGAARKVVLSATGIEGIALVWTRGMRKRTVHFVGSIRAVDFAVAFLQYRYASTLVSGALVQIVVRSARDRAIDFVRAISAYRKMIRKMNSKIETVKNSTKKS